MSYLNSFLFALHLWESYQTNKKAEEMQEYRQLYQDGLSVLLGLFVFEGCPVMNVSRIETLHEKKKLLPLICP